MSYCIDSLKIPASEASGSAKRINSRANVLTVDTSVERDTLEPALNPDGTMKDASEIEWLHSPSDELTASLSKRPWTEDSGDNLDFVGVRKRARVSTRP